MVEGMKALIVGHGAREHAITKALSRSDVELQAAMSRMNPGIAALSEKVEIMDINEVEDYSRFGDVDIAFIGPEAPLAAGVTDTLEGMGVPVVGPSREAARLEWSKAHTRRFLEENGIEGNPEFSICRTRGEVEGFLEGHPDIAVKPDVLTGGKGVKITGEHLHGPGEVMGYAMERIAGDGLVILEEKLDGREFTLQAFTDGRDIEVMPLVRDFKRAYDGDQGPNTGSMGSYSCPDHGLQALSPRSIRKGTEIMEDTIRKLEASGTVFKGFLYGGFMETLRGVYLLEYNVRLGDPEAMNVLSLLEDPLLDIGWEIVDGNLSTPSFSEKATVCVYIVPEGYPVDPKSGNKITIAPPEWSELYYASVHQEGGVIRTTGSRAIALLAKGDSVREAREKVYRDVPKIRGALFYRRDIGAGV
ncbi:MAG: phosphoribosylamine--glycine ligase [Candidatus Bathyarchaeota archaeon]|jgi:phosphoribosylamine--glycine ligase